MNAADITCLIAVGVIIALALMHCVRTIRSGGCSCKGCNKCEMKNCCCNHSKEENEK